MSLESTPKRCHLIVHSMVFFVADFGSESSAVRGCYVLLPQLLRKLNLNSSKNKDKAVSISLSLKHTTY